MSLLYQHTTELSEIAWLYPTHPERNYYGIDSIESCEAKVRTPIAFATSINAVNQVHGIQWLKEHNWKAVASKLNAFHGTNVITLWIKVFSINKAQSKLELSNFYQVESGNWMRGASGCCGLLLRKVSTTKPLSEYRSRYLVLWERSIKAKPRAGWREVAKGVKRSYWVNA